GHLAVDDEVTKFLPDYPTNGYHLTVRHLLNQSSGIHNYIDGPAPFFDFTQSASRGEVVKRFAGQFDSPPGQDWRYSNSNYYLLGLIIEKVSGVPYSTYLTDQIFAPLGMRDTSYCPDGPTGANPAKGYWFDSDNKPGLIPKIVGELAFAAGGMCSTVEDLVRWNVAFHSHRFLTAASYQLMTTPARLDDGRPSFYGFGLALGITDTPPKIHHSGGMPGFWSWLGYFPDQNMTVVVLANGDFGSAVTGDLITGVTRIAGGGDTAALATPGG
ncbi:MAG: beta-lactamase family protein, partial [Actinobacteria bacterium]|nr:beta-lactamase family protein [Actinomycetota bacterium]